jgi:hypothetical protein
LTNGSIRLLRWVQSSLPTSAAKRVRVGKNVSVSMRAAFIRLQLRSQMLQLTKSSRYRQRGGLVQITHAC